MSNKKYKLKGHESFVLREGWLSKGIIAVKDNNRLFSKNVGPDALGVGTNMAKSIKYWLKISGLIEENKNKGYILSNLGEIIYENDIYFEDIFTLWIIHSNIVCNLHNATSWNVFFNNMNYSSYFNRAEMQSMLKSLLIEYIGENTLPDRSIKDDCAAILSMYTKHKNINDDPENKNVSPFEVLGLIESSNDNYIKKRPSEFSLNELVLLYIIIDDLNANNGIQIDYVLDGFNMPGRILNLNRIITNGLLDKLENQNYITINRTAGLDMIYPKSCSEMSKIDVVKEYFGGKRK